MNTRLLSLIVIVAGCIAVIYSQAKKESEMKEYRAILARPCERPIVPPRETWAAADNWSFPSPPIAPAPPAVADTSEDTAPPEDSWEDQVKKDPYAAAQKAEVLPPGYERLTALNRVATAWASQDPSAALTWAGQLSDPADRVAVTSNALFAWGQSDPQKAISYAEACDLGDQAVPTMGILVQKLAGSDLNSAVTYASQQPDGALKDELLSRVALVEAVNDPVGAGQMISDDMVSGPAQTEAAISVLHQWALKDPDAAANWAASFPEGDLKDRALNEIAAVASVKSSP